MIVYLPRMIEIGNSLAEILQNIWLGLKSLPRYYRLHKYMHRLYFWKEVIILYILLNNGTLGKVRVQFLGKIYHNINLPGANYYYTHGSSKTDIRINKKKLLWCDVFKINCSFDIILFHSLYYSPFTVLWQRKFS